MGLVRASEKASWQRGELEVVLPQSLRAKMAVKPNAFTALKDWGGGKEAG